MGEEERKSSPRSREKREGRLREATARWHKAVRGGVRRRRGSTRRRWTARGEGATRRRETARGDGGAGRCGGDLGRRPGGNRRCAVDEAARGRERRQRGGFKVMRRGRESEKEKRWARDLKT